jgi:hypothetical protein
MMKKIILASVLSLTLVVAFGSIANAQLAKEGTFSIIEYGNLPGEGVKVIAMGEERVHCTYENTGILVNDAGKGFLHRAASHWLGQLHAVNGVKQLETGFAVYTDADGDNVYLTFDWKGIAFKSSEGTGTFVGGTGKYTGITGSCEMTWCPAPQPKKDVFQGITTLKGHYKLP